MIQRAITKVSITFAPRSTLKPHHNSLNPERWMQLVAISFEVFTSITLGGIFFSSGSGPKIPTLKPHQKSKTLIILEAAGNGQDGQ